LEEDTHHEFQCKKYMSAPEERIAQGPRPDPKIEKFRDAVKSAENSTLLFNLDMGRVPIMNKETIAKNSTLAIAKMAANKEKPGSIIPSEDIVAGIDDILSVTTGFELYGTATKSYKHPASKDSGAFCTVPVRYDFADRETRFQAEKFLREKCDIQCTIPYHPTLRECIKQIISNIKTEYPGNQARVTIDTGKLCLNISRRENGSKNDPKPWIRCKSVPVPDEALDTEMKKIPQGFKINWKTRSVSASTDTGAEEPGGAAGTVTGDIGGASGGATGPRVHVSMEVADSNTVPAW
jgi:hypothetical protein